MDYDHRYVLIGGIKAHPTRLLAKLKPDVLGEEQRQVIEPLELKVARTDSLLPQWVVLDSTRGLPGPVKDAEEARRRGDELTVGMQSLRASGRYECVEPDYLIQLDRAPSDAFYSDGSLWGLANTGQSGGVAGTDINAAAAWDITTGDRRVIVAVIDTGVRTTHQDLAGQLWRNLGEIPGNGIDDDANGYVDDVHGMNAIAETGDPTDDNGHGTHVSGTIGAAANGGGGHVGVAWKVQLMVCKNLNAKG